MAPDEIRAPQLHPAGAVALQDRRRAGSMTAASSTATCARAMEVADWSELQAASASRRRQRAGSAASAWPPISRPAPSAARRDRARCASTSDGTVTLLIGTQIDRAGASDRLRPVRRRSTSTSDGADPRPSRATPTWSRPAAAPAARARSRVGGASVAGASRELAEKIKQLAADELEAGVGDIELVDGTVRIVGTDRAIGFADLAAGAPRRRRSSSRDRRQLEAGRGDLSERHAYLRGRDRPGDRRDRESCATRSSTISA